MTLMAMLRSRERVRLTAFNCFEGDIKGDGREIRRQMHDWVDVKSRESDREVAAKISSHSIHVIIDMSGTPHADRSKSPSLALMPSHSIHGIPDF
jgi:predicted O-linked N-acetylglucosamine transferase (SPINDLY family)